MNHCRDTSLSSVHFIFVLLIGDKEGISVCDRYTASIGVNGTEIEVCVRSEPLAYLLLAVYLLFTIVLLLNLLIAILKSVFLP